MSISPQLAWPQPGRLTTPEPFPGPHPWADPMYYGAQGDGKHDDSAAFQAAVNAASANGSGAGGTGGYVLLGAYTYKIGASLTVPSNVSFLSFGATLTGVGAGSVGPIVVMDTAGNLVAKSVTVLSSGPYSSLFPAGVTNILSSGEAGALYDMGGQSITITGPKYRAIGTWDPVAGTGDALAAINQAITDLGSAGGILYFPPGIYVVSAKIVPTSKIWFRGSGANSAIIQPATGSYHVIEATSTSDVWVSDLTIDGTNQGAGGGAGVAYKTAATRPIVQRCRIVNMQGRGIYVEGATDALIEGNYLNNITTLHGITFEAVASSHIRVANNRITNVTLGHGISLGNAGTTNATVTGNDVDTTGLIGIALGSGASDVTVVGNVIKSTTDNGIDIGNVVNATISGNLIDTCKGGIVSDYSSGATLQVANVNITGNTILNSQNTSFGAIYLDGSSAGHTDGFTVQGNAIQSPVGDGIRILRIGRSTIGNNVVSGVPSTFGGIRLMAGAQRLTINGNALAGPAGSIGILYDAGYNGFANEFIGNQLQSVATKVSGTPSTQDIFRGNFGYNPLGAVNTPGFPATGTTLTNDTNCDVAVYLLAGTNAVTVDITGGTLGAVSSVVVVPATTYATFVVPPNPGGIKVTYGGGSPSWKWVGN